MEAVTEPACQDRRHAVVLHVTAQQSGTLAHYLTSHNSGILPASFGSESASTVVIVRSLKEQYGGSSD